MSKESSTADRSVNQTIDVRTRAMDAATSVAERSKDGSVALLAGGTLLVRAVRSRRKRGRATVQTLVGAALVGFGLRQRRSEESIVPTADVETIDRGGSGTSEERTESHQPDANPRGTSGEPDVETETEPDEGSVQFDEDQTDGERSEPHLDESSAGDPRLDEDDETTEVDLSNASLADEASEATGPASEQAQPTQTEETEPERSPPEDAATTPTDESDQSDDAADDDDESAQDDQDDDSA